MALDQPQRHGCGVRLRAHQADCHRTGFIIGVDFGDIAIALRPALIHRLAVARGYFQYVAIGRERLGGQRSYLEYQGLGHGEVILFCETENGRCQGKPFIEYNC